MVVLVWKDFAYFALVLIGTWQRPSISERIRPIWISESDLCAVEGGAQACLPSLRPSDVL